MGWFNHQLVCFFCLIDMWIYIYIARHIKKGSFLKRRIEVGAPGDNDRGDFSGAAYVFLRKADSFMEQVGGPKKCFTKDLGFWT